MLCVAMQTAGRPAGRCALAICGTSERARAPIKQLQARGRHLRSAVIILYAAYKNPTAAAAAAAGPGTGAAATRPVQWPKAVMAAVAVRRLARFIRGVRLYYY